jgi:hypothetical protein
VQFGMHVQTPLTHVSFAGQATHAAPFDPQVAVDELEVDGGTQVCVVVQHPEHVTGHCPPQPSLPPQGLLAQLGVQTHW